MSVTYVYQERAVLNITGRKLEKLLKLIREKLRYSAT